MINIIAIVFISVGLLFFLGATIGIIRFPDFYTRMHAAGKGDTLSTFLILTGFAIYNLAHPSWASFIVSAKIMMICVFIFITSPTVTHALMDAGVEAGAKPWSKKKKENKEGADK